MSIFEQHETRPPFFTVTPVNAPPVGMSMMLAENEIQAVIEIMPTRS
jgi:hypothetical protein